MRNQRTACSYQEKEQVQNRFRQDGFVNTYQGERERKRERERIRKKGRRKGGKKWEGKEKEKGEREKQRNSDW